MISNFVGEKKFFSKVFLTALHSLALIKDGKNYNYYEEKKSAEALKSEIIKSFKAQIDFGARKDKVVLLGKKNADYLKPINDEYKFFDKIIILEHPRYIMQYKLKSIRTYIDKYLQTLKS